MAPSYNIGIIGYGLSAKVFHIPLLLTTPTLDLHAIVQRSPTPDNDASLDHPNIKIYNTSSALLADPAISAVIITTIPTSHFALCKLALEADKHVVVEKPFTPTSAEADELVALARERGRLLTVYQNRRWDADFLTLTQLLSSNTLGRIVEFATHFDRHRPLAPAAHSSWKAEALPGGGAVYDLGAHLIDQVVVAFGVPARVTGFVGAQREGGPEGVEDSCMVLLHYGGGMMATVKAGVVSAEVEQLRFWVRGERGSYRKFHLDPQEDQLKAGMKPGDAEFGVEPDERAGSLTTMEGGVLRREKHPNVRPATYGTFYSEFADALAGKGEVPVKPEGARDVIRLIELARLSSREGRTLSVGNHYDGID